MKRAAAYIRVSTEEQTELSPDSQAKLIREYAQKNNMVLLDEHIYHDDGISGRTTAKRAGFNRMIAAAKRKPKPFDVILVWKFSRFARNREDSIVYKSMLRKQCGIDVVSISENIGDDKMSVLVEAMIEAMDEYYSVNLAEEVKRGMDEAFERGKLISSAPFGYTVKDGELAVNESEAQIVRRIFDKFINGKGALGIARELNAEGILTKYGNTWENRTVKYILMNPTYIGMHRRTVEGKGAKSHFKNENDIVKVTKGHHLPIISEETFNQAAERIRRDKERFGGEHTAGKSYMLKGLVKCSACGATLSLHKDGLQCYKYFHGKCTVSHYVSLSIINKLVIDDMARAASSGDIAVIYREHKTNDTAEAEKRLERERRRLERIKAAYEDGAYTLTEFKEAKASVTARIEEIQAEIKPTEAPSKEAIQETLRERLKSVLEIVRSDTDETTKNTALKTVIDHVVFTRSDSTCEVFYFCG